MPPPRGTDRRYEPQLDGLRAYAVLAVAWSHWAPRHQYGIPFGFGVHLFFVLSGYLITGILLDIRGMRRFHGIGVFFLRRVLRIFPAYYVTVGLALLGGLAIVRETWPWHVAYLSNVLAFERSQWLGMTSHWWSLAVEEQFYLAWPWLIVFAPRSWLLPMVAFAMGAAPLCRAWLVAAGHPVEFAMVLTPSSLDCLGAGALLALARWRAREQEPMRPLLWVAAVAASSVALALAVWPSIATLQTAAQTAAGVVFAWVVSNAAQGFTGFGRRLLEAAPIVYLGRISYGFYLIHNFAFAMVGVVVAAFGGDVLGLWPPARLLLLFVVTLGLAAASWHAMEKPLNDAKRFLPYSTHGHTGARVRLMTGS